MWQQFENCEEHLEENKPNHVHKLIASEPSVLAQQRDLGVTEENSLKTSAQWINRIIQSS